MTDSKSRSKAGLERKEAEEVIEKFLDPKNDAKVFALKGDWGVGKTHLVKTFLSSTENKYYYSSVFGLSSVDGLKMQLWSNFQPANTEEESSSSPRFNFKNLVKLAKEYSEPISKIIGKVPNVGEIGGAATSSAISLISNMLINNMLNGQLVCIDDLERRSSKLQLDELLGFIESLVEQHKCKVILIYNEDKLCENAKSRKILNEYREKVIDTEIKLAPTVDENFYIAFDKDYPDEKIIFDYLSKEYVQTNNIRILKKLRSTLNRLRPFIEDFLPSIRQSIIKEIAFISLAKFDKKFPINLSKLLDLGDFSKILNDRIDEDKNVYFNAINLGYSASPISDEIIRLVETSICDFNKFREVGKQLNDREEQKQIKQRLSETCSSYYQSFGASEAEISNNLTEFLNNYCHFLGFTELVGLEDLAKAIDLDLSIYKRTWIKHKIDNPDTFTSLIFLQSVCQEFPDLMSELEEKMKSIEASLSITQVLSKSEQNQSLSQEEANYLNGRTVEDYKQWLVERDIDPDKYNRYYMVNQGLNMGGTCSKNLHQAIIELAQKSKLNALRAKKLYNIDINQS
jgi:hypothetical protein